MNAIGVARKRYFVRENVQVAVGVLLTRSSPTQAGGNVMASGPEIDDVVAAKVPVPENAHVAKDGSGMAPAATVKATDVSCAPETVPDSVAMTIWPSPTSMRTGPETLAPLWVAIQEAIAQHSDSPDWANLPVHVPATLSTGADVGEVGVTALPPESPLQPTVRKQMPKKRVPIATDDLKRNIHPPGWGPVRSGSAVQPGRRDCGAVSFCRVVYFGVRTIASAKHGISVIAEAAPGTFRSSTAGAFSTASYNAANSRSYPR